MKDKLMLIDGHSIINRAFYAIPLLTTKNGQHTNAIYGFLNILFKLMEEESPKYIGVSFDLPKPTFRHLKYSEYKGNRKKTPPELKSQVPVLKEILKTMGIDIYEKEGYEADDVLATVAKKAEKCGLDAVIVSGDRDLLQIATDNIKIKIPKTKAGKTEIEDYFAKDVLAKYGVTPTEFIEVKALMGDNSDNVPGVPSIGEKTAIKLIHQYKTVENVIENAQNIKSKKASEMLLQYKDQAMLSKYLVTIDTDVPIEFSFENLGCENIFNDAFFEICKEYELKSFISKFDISKNNALKEESENFNLILNIEDAQKYFENLDKNEEIAYKFIFNEDKFWGISFYYKLDTGTFIKINENLQEEDLISIFKPFFGEEYKKISHNLKTELVFLNKYNIEIKNVIFDTMIAAYILNSTKNKYEYNNIANEFLDTHYPDIEELLGRLKSKRALFEIEQEEWLKYCIRQSKVSYLAKEIMQELIKKDEQEMLFYNIEMPLIYVLADMEILGIKVSETELIEYKKNLEKEIDNLTKEIYWLAGDEQFNINSPKQLGEVLFEKMGLKGGKKTATGWTTAADVLEKIAHQNEIIPKILEYRIYTKLKSTYADGLLNVLDKKTGRIHSNFKQTVTATGRLSSTEPNLQNIPIRIELGHKIRKVFKPEKDFIFVDADYSQIELRVLAHLSEDEILINAFNEGQDIHKLTASQIFNKNINDVTSFERSAAKAINFGLIYGKQAFSLSQELGITKKDAENYIKEYFEKYPKVKVFLKNVVENAKKDGYVKTIFNRKRYIPEITSSNFMQKGAAERVAMNTPIQGAAADIIKLAMIKVYNRIKAENLQSRLILQVHDELLIEAHKTEVEKIKLILLEEMQDVINFSVKLLIDIHTGEDWYEAK